MNTFGWAIKQMHDGKKVARAGWNGKKMWIALTPGTVIEPHLAREGAAKHLQAEIFSRSQIMGHEEKIVIGAHIDMKAADGTLVIGWLASQTDMLATDWSIV